MRRWPRCGPQEPVESMRLQFEKRRQLMVELLRQFAV